LSVADPLQATVAAADALEAIGIRYAVGGSLASSVHGMPRSTRDVDLLAEVRPGDADRLAAVLEGAFHVDPESVREAVRDGSSFNVFHKETLFKVDVFVLHDDLGRAELDRRDLHELVEGRGVFVSTPEDTVLRKLEWYRKGGELSDQQWKDVLGVLEVQAGKMDLAYLSSWAARLGIGDLLERALARTDAAP
jgi:hypothetical protein